MLKKSDILVIKKTNLVPYVGVILEVMPRDALAQRPDKSVFFARLKQAEETVEIEACLLDLAGL